MCDCLCTAHGCSPVRAVELTSYQLTGVAYKWDKISMNLRYMKSMKILVMDWLPAHHAVLECFNKVVKLSISSKPMMRYHGNRNVVSPCLISALTARRLLAKGCQEILAYVLDNKKKVPVLEEIPVVKDFFSMFS